MASEPKVGDVRKEGRAWCVFIGARTWLGVGHQDHAKMLSAELSAAREMREVLRECENALGFCPFCEGPETTGPLIHAPDCRLARLIGGGE